MLNGYKKPKGYKAQNSFKTQEFLDDILNSKAEVPDELDWRKVEGRVSEIKNQGSCGSCWAFASTGGLEGQMKVRNATFQTLSEQDLVDCSPNDGGCDGGFMTSAYEDLAKLGGIESERAYPYEAKQGQCRYDKNKSVFSNKGASELPDANEDKLKEVVAKFGPVPVGISH